MSAAVDGFKYRYYVTGATSDLFSLPGNPKPNASDAPLTMACRKGCKLTEIESVKAKCKRGSDG
eukprot:997918-Prymnesium_polylepis.1